MKRLSRLTALLLAIMLSLSMIPAALAEEVMTKNQLDDLVLQTIENFPNLPVEEQYSVIMSLKDDQEAAEMLLGTLSEEQYQALEAYAISQQEPVEIKSYTFTDAGPFLPAVNVAQMRMMRMMARAANDAAVDNEGVISSKTVTGNATDGYVLRLESYVTGKTTVSTVTKSTPVDIVLVLDQSGSMAYNFNGDSTNTNADRRQYAMKQAVNQFIASVADKYEETADHRMAIVTFGSNASTLQGWTFVDEAGEATLTNKISGLPNSPSGATNVAAGMTQAETLMGTGYSYTGRNTTRQKVVIVFTDGVPTTESEFNTTVATNAIASAKKLKDAGVTVYTVGIFNGVDAEQLHGEKVDYTLGGDTICDGSVGSRWGAGFLQNLFGDVRAIDIAAGNRFLNYLSSNFKTATEIGIKEFSGLASGWEITKNFNRDASGYYLTATDSTSLNNIFQTISENIQTGAASVTLDSDTVVKDVVTDYFTIKDQSVEANQIKVYTADYNKDGSWDAEVASSLQPVVANGTVTVTGFDFSKNYCDASNGRDENDASASGTFYGRKLIIEIPIEVRDGFWGGNNVPTNGADSGIYSDGAVVENYDEPAVNVPLNVPALETENKNIYLLSAAPAASDLYNSADFVKQTGENAWQTAFVNISTTGADGTISNIDDTTVNIEVTVEASEAANADSVGTAVTAPVKQKGEAKVYVFKPVLTFKDSVVDYLQDGIGAEYYQVNNDGGIVWMHGTTASTEVTMTGLEPGSKDGPTLNVTYMPVASSWAPGGVVTAMEDVPVNVSVAIDGTAVAEADLTFVHAQCNCTLDAGKSCGWTAQAGEFIVHVKNIVADLTITKTGLNEYAYKDGTDRESAIFTVKATDKTGKVQTWIIALANGESVTIKDLKVNSQYTIAEQNAWTWRYENMAPVTGTITRDENGNGVTVTIENEAEYPYWLGGDNYATNVFGDSN